LAQKKKKEVKQLIYKRKFTRRRIKKTYSNNQA